MGDTSVRDLGRALAAAGPASEWTALPARYCSGASARSVAYALRTGARAGWPPGAFDVRVTGRTIFVRYRGEPQCPS